MNKPPFPDLDNTLCGKFNDIGTGKELGVIVKREEWEKFHRFMANQDATYFAAYRSTIGRASETDALRILLYVMCKSRYEARSELIQLREELMKLSARLPTQFIQDNLTGEIAKL